MSLFLTTPDQHDFQDPTVELDEKRLQRWLAGLPVLNPGESLRHVLNALEPLNEQRMDSGKRLRLLALYQATVKRLYDAADPLSLRQQPLSQRQRQETVDDVERLCLAMANGLKLVVRELHAGGQVQDMDLFATALRRTVKQLAATLLHAYRYHRPEPPFVFLELNQLYRVARHHGVHELAAGNEVQSSLATVYKAVSLLALTDPFSGGEGQAGAYYSTLMRHAESARIIPGNSWQGVPEGLYFIDLQSDSRPRHCVLLESPVAGDDPYILDARAPLQRMHQALAALPADRRRQRPEAGILRALLPEVKPRDKRRSERRAAGHRIEVVVGLDAIAAWLEQLQRGRRPDAEEWRVKDVSEDGYCLAWDRSAASALRVGELICLVSDSEASQQPPRLLVLRWLRDEREQGTRLGVEKLEGVPAPVRLTAAGDEGSQPALFLPSTGAEGPAARLVATEGVYEPGRPLLIRAGERRITARCGELLEQGAGFDCFAFLAG
ncbi:MAG TPA: hypothetical protein ENK05_07180 [Gammaproteobacteria bacterium]|nr:hypothetical protein [Gammaproteobacteria bacterium]